MYFYFLIQNLEDNSTELTDSLAAAARNAENVSKVNQNNNVNN
jgi:hypothetical protein